MTRTRIWLIVAAVVVVALVVGAGVWWYTYTRSPAYSLTQLTRAVQEGNWSEFQRYVDVDAVVGGLVDSAVEESAGGGDTALGAAAASLADSLKSALATQAREQLQAAVEGGMGSDTVAGAVAPYLVAASVRSVTYDGDEAIVTVAVPIKGETIDVDLLMQRAGDHWRVTSVQNVDGLGSLLGLPGLGGE